MTNMNEITEHFHHDLKSCNCKTCQESKYKIAHPDVNDIHEQFSKVIVYLVEKKSSGSYYAMKVLNKSKIMG